jgi:hypothetical protein
MSSLTWHVPLVIIQWVVGWYSAFPPLDDFPYAREGDYPYLIEHCKQKQLL